MLANVINQGLRHARKKTKFRVITIQLRRFNWDLSTPNVKFSNLKELYVGTLKAEDSIADYVERHNLRSILLIASKHLDEKSPKIQKIENRLGNRIKEKITGIREHNPSEDAFNSIEMARDYNVDCILCVGGGSVIDNGKIASILKNEPINNLNKPEDIDNYIAQVDEKQRMILTPLHYDFNIINEEKPNPHTIMVPTTLVGTTHIAGYYSMTRNKKCALTHPSIMPECCVFDPLITEYTPKWLWYSTAIRAIDHCIETICSQYGNVFWENLALNTLRSYLKYLPLTYQSRISEKKEYNMEYYARLKCLTASLNAILPIGQGCPMGASHGIGYTMGSLYNTPHGYTSCVLSPSVLKWNLLNDNSKNDFINLKQLKLKRVFWEVFDEPNYDNEINHSIDKFQEVVAASFNINASKMSVHEMLKQFVTMCGLPTTLKEININDEKIDKIVESCTNSPLLAKNPVPISKAEHVREILQIAKG